MNTLVEQLIPYASIFALLALAIGVTRLFIDLISKFDESLSDSAREQIRRRISPDEILRLSRATERVFLFPASVSKKLDAFFGPDLLEGRAFKRSCIISVSVASFAFIVVIATMFVRQQLGFGNKEFDTLKLFLPEIAFPIAGLYLANCAVDSVAIVKTRLLMRSLAGCKSMLLLAATLIFDVLTTLVIYLAGTAAAVFIMLSIVGYMIFFPLLWGGVTVSEVDSISLIAMLKMLYIWMVGFPLSVCANVLDPSILIASLGFYSEIELTIDSHAWVPFDGPKLAYIALGQEFVGHGTLLTPFLFSTFTISALTLFYIIVRCAALLLLSIISVFKMLLFLVDFPRFPIFTSLVFVLFLVFVGIAGIFLVWVIFSSI